MGPVVEMKETFHQAQGSTHKPVEKGLFRIYNMRFCPYAQRSLLVATAKGMKFDVVNINLTDKPDWFLALNPKGQVPTLEHDDGRVVAESLIVADYLDEIGDKSKPLHPKDPFEKAKDRLLVERFNLVTTPIYKVLFSLDKPDFDMEPFNTMLTSLDLFEEEIKARGPFFGGAHPNMVDYMIWPWFERIEFFSHFGGDKLLLPKDRFAKLLGWTKVMKEDEAVKKWLLPSEVHVQFMKGRLAGATDYDFLARQGKD